MHEFGIAQGLLEAVLAKAQEVQAPRVTAIRLAVGVFSGIETDALAFAFASLAADTPAATARLMIETIPGRCYCSACQELFECAPADYRCPRCGQTSPDMRTGREMKLIAMEVD